MKETLDSILAFLKTGIWFLPETGLSRPKALLLRASKVLLLAARGFDRDQCAVRASALTFYSLLSVVPVLAVVFGIAKGFGFDKRLQAELLVKFSERSDILMQVFRFSDSMLEKTSGGIVAGIGVALLFWSVVKVLGSIEDAFNDIWKVPRPRSIARKCSDYLSFAMVCPLIFLMSSSLMVTVAGQVKYVAERAAGFGIPPQAFLLLIEFLPLVLIWVLFAFLLIYMPNTRVRLGPGIAAAAAAGTAYYLTQWVYISFQVGVSRANAIYGSFAALPLFLAWMQISWLIVLMGSEISFAAQNLDSIAFPEGSEKISPHHRKVLSLLVARLVVKNFTAGEKPLGPHAIARALGIPSSLVLRALSDLSAAGLLAPMKAEGTEEPAWQPARDVHGITVADVIGALERCGAAEPPFLKTEESLAVAGVLDALGKTLETSPANKPLLDL
jgi:membrane protein